MFDAYMMDYFCLCDCGHHIVTSYDLLDLTSRIDNSVYRWRILKVEIIEGITYPRNVIARSANV